MKQSEKIIKSLAMQDRARKLIPGMTQLLSKRPDMFSLGVWPGYFAKAKGVYVWDLDGNKYLDMSIAGIGANVLGYADPDVDAAVINAVRNGTSCSLNCPEEVELAELMLEINPWAEQIRYTRTGGESMSVAVRIARAATGRDIIAFCGYHGWHDWYIAANVGTENALGEHLICGLSPRGVPSQLAGTSYPFRYNHLEELERVVLAYGHNLAAIILEPIRNERPAEGFMQGVRDIATRVGAVLIVDEISSGLRMNTGGAHLEFGLRPDIAVYSKALGNGYPIGAIVGIKNVMEAAQGSFISSTYWTERIGPTAAIATIRKHRERNAGPHLMTIGKLIQDGWTNAGKRYGLGIHVGGIYPLSHFAFDGDTTQTMKALFIQNMVAKGILASTSFYSMLAHTQEHVDTYLRAIDEVFLHLVKSRDAGTIETQLEGKPSSVGFKRLN